MMDAQPQLFRDTGAILVESLWWDGRSDEVVWVDITAGTLHRGRMDGAVDGRDDRVSALPPPVSAVQPDDRGGFVAALRDDIVRLDGEGRIVETLAHVEHHHGGIRFNEGKVDPFGRFVVGSMNVTTGEPDGALYAVSGEGALRTLRGGFAVANGMEWSDSGEYMFVTDTAVKTVYRGAYGADGDLGPLEPLLVGYPSDGLALDVDGRFWNGVYGGGRVICWSADGEEIENIDVPAPNITSVAFGGPDLTTLLIGSARENLTENDLQDHPLSGAIFRLDGLAHGRSVNTFGNRKE